MKIFISYAHVDEKDVRGLVEILRRAHHDPWFDHRLIGGQLFDKQLLAAIQSCDCFLYALTLESVESSWCQWEFAQAVHAGKPVIPVVMQTNTPLPGILKRIEYIDWSQGAHGLAVASLLGCIGVAETVSPDEVPLLPVPMDEPDRLVGVAKQSRARADQTFDKAHERYLVGEYEEALELVLYCLELEAGHREAQTLRKRIEGRLAKQGATSSVPTVLRVEDSLPPPFEWVEIPAGSVILEDARSIGGTKGGPYKVPAFFIAKYPITNAQYQVFLDSPDGFQDTRWWDYSDEAKSFRARHAEAPDTGFAGENLPRTKVAWFDAMAFCHWLSVTTHQNITLPTEQQWQRAAQGDDGRKYPWGDEFYADCCNSSVEAESKGPTSVMAYPDGASPFGVMDMSGNIWEWSLTVWGPDSTRVSTCGLRGGSWSSTLPAFLHNTGRDSLGTAAISDVIGFRISRPS